MKGTMWQLVEDVGQRLALRAKWHLELNHSEDKLSCAFC